MSIIMVVSWSINSYLRLPPPVHTVHFGRKAHWWCIAVKSTLERVNELLGVGWLLHHLCHSVDDVSTPVFDRVLVTVIPSHILQSV
jgi:hypothetical protein